MSSILTNNSAMVALETLKGINRGMSQVQSEISTGKKIATAKDNAALWAISTVMSTDMASFEQISDSLSLGSATIGVARDASEEITDLIKDAKKLIVSAQEENVDQTKIQTDIAAIASQVDSIVGAAQFNGLNLIDGTSTTAVNILSSLDRDAAGTVTASSISVDRQDLAAVATGLAAIDVTADAAGALTSVEALLTTSIDASAAFGSAQKRIGNQINFVSSLADSLKSGIGALTDADMEEASARLQSLQVQQQLGVQALSIANQNPQNLLALFR